MEGEVGYDPCPCRRRRCWTLGRASSQLDGSDGDGHGSGVSVVESRVELPPLRTITLVPLEGCGCRRRMPSSTGVNPCVLDDIVPHLIGFLSLSDYYHVGR